MNIKLQKTWTIDRTFEYELSDVEFKRKYKTQKNFKEQFKKNPDQIINYLTKQECISVCDDESDGTFMATVTKK